MAQLIIKDDGPRISWRGLGCGCLIVFALWIGYLSETARTGAVVYRMERKMVKASYKIKDLFQKFKLKEETLNKEKDALLKLLNKYEKQKDKHAKKGKKKNKNTAVIKRIKYKLKKINKKLKGVQEIRMQLQEIVKQIEDVIVIGEKIDLNE